MARPTSRSPEIIVLLKQAFSMGATVSGACYHAGIAESTYYDWASKDTEFSEDMKAQKEKPILLALNTVVKDLHNPLTAKWYLEKRHDSFKQRTEVKHDGTMLSVVTSEMTLEEAEQAYAENLRSLKEG